jgi:DNA polymerase sigma
MGARARRAARNKTPLPPPRCVPQLHQEILAFAEQLRETDEEKETRERTVARCTKVVQEVEVGARLHVFGSCATDLRLPQGDIDLMVEAPRSMNREKQLLSRLGDALKVARVSGRLLPLPHARVPILKYTDRETRVNVDACVNRIDALRSTALLARSSAALPALRPLALVLKSQMALHQLHETHSGGVGGYLLANMLRHVLLRPPPPPVRASPGERRRARAAQLGAADADAAAAAAVEAAAEEVEAEDLGGQLLRFFWYYGFEHDYASSVVMLDGDATSVASSAHDAGFLEHSSQMLSINDPNAPWSDLGAKAHNFGSVRRLLRLTYTQLLSRIELLESLESTAPDQRHVPTWLLHKREAAAARRQAKLAKRTRRGESAGAMDDAEPADDAQTTILGVVLPRWQVRWDQSHARKQQRKRSWIGALRLDEERKLDEATARVAAEMGGAGSRDPLWATDE